MPRRTLAFVEGDAKIVTPTPIKKGFPTRRAFALTYLVIARLALVLVLIRLLRMVAGIILPRRSGKFVNFRAARHRERCESADRDNGGEIHRALPRGAGGKNPFPPFAASGLAARLSSSLWSHRPCALLPVLPPLPG
jgi:hypothetical protein